MKQGLKSCRAKRYVGMCKIYITLWCVHVLRSVGYVHIPLGLFYSYRGTCMYPHLVSTPPLNIAKVIEKK